MRGTRRQLRPFDSVAHRAAANALNCICLGRSSCPGACEYRIRSLSLVKVVEFLFLKLNV